MGKIDDIQAYKEWTEYHRSLKRDKAADNLSPVERKKKLEKLEANVIEWILFFFSEFAKYQMAKFCELGVESDVVIGKGIDMEDLFGRRILIEKVIIQPTKFPGKNSSGLRMQM